MCRRNNSLAVLLRSECGKVIVMERVIYGLATFDAYHFLCVSHATETTMYHSFGELFSLLFIDISSSCNVFALIAPLHARQLQFHNCNVSEVFILVCNPKKKANDMLQ